jgi:diguanylate cyclase (GGDEF)-like protein
MVGFFLLRVQLSATFTSRGTAGQDPCAGTVVGASKDAGSQPPSPLLPVCPSIRQGLFPMTFLDESFASQLSASRILVVTAGGCPTAGSAPLLVAAGFSAVRAVRAAEAADAAVAALPEAVLLELTPEIESAPDAGPVPDAGPAPGAGSVAHLLGEEALWLLLDRLTGPAVAADPPVVLLMAPPGAVCRLRTRALAHGVADVLPLPADADELAARLRPLLAVRRLQRETADLSAQLAHVQTQQLRSAEGEQFLHAMLDNIEECVIACDDDGRMAFANRSAARLGLGTSGSGRVPALAAEHLRSADGERLAAAEDPLQRAWSGHQVVDQELMVDDPHGGRRTFVVNSRPLLVEPGRRLGAVVALHDVTEQRRLIEQLRRGLMRDETTGLLNIATFLEVVDRATARTSRDHRPMAVLAVVVDEVVGSRPADGGVDEPALAALARRLPALLRPGDTAARYREGFAVMCEAPVDEVHARLIGDRLRVGLSRPVEVGGRVVVAQLSIGVRTVRSDETAPEELLQDALVAALRAKQHGRGAAETLEAMPREEFLRRRDLVAELHHALPWGEFQVHYQPTVDLRTGLIVGAEALSRWPRPGRGSVLPDRFLPVARQTGMLGRLEAWVLRTVCEQLRAWEATGSLDPGFSVSVNVSAQAVRARGWPEQVVRIVHETGADPRRLLLEITRDTLTDDPDLVLQALTEVQAHRIRFALDDLGARPPEALLGRFPIDVLKVGRTVVSAVTGPGPAGGRAAELIELGHRFGMVTVATGVETAQQASVLVGLGCQQAQGRYFGDAVPADRLTALLV